MNPAPPVTRYRTPPAEARTGPAEPVYILPLARHRRAHDRRVSVAALQPHRVDTPLPGFVTQGVAIDD